MNVTSFIESLNNSEGRFRTLRGVFALRGADGEPLVTTDELSVCCEVSVGGGRYFLRTLLHPTDSLTERLREVSEFTQRINSPFLTPQLLLPAEMLVFNAAGTAEWIDVVLQQIPAGERLEHVFEPTDALLTRLHQMAEWLAASDFSHNAITARNIIVAPNTTPVLIDYMRATHRSSNVDQQAINSLLWRLEADLVPAPEPLAKYVSIAPVHNGVMCAFDGQRWTYIDKKGRQTVPGSFLEAEDFAENRAVVRISQGWGMIDIDGRWVVKPQLDDLEWDCIHNVAIATQGGASWLIGRGGERLCGADYEQIMSGSEGLFPMRSNGRYGFLLRDGSIAIDPQFDDASGFQDGHARVRLGDEYFIINYNGDIVQKINC